MEQLALFPRLAAAPPRAVVRRVGSPPVAEAAIPEQLDWVQLQNEVEQDDEYKRKQAAN